MDSNFLEERGILTLILEDKKHFSSYPPDAKVRLRLTENKFSETVEFGTIGKPSSTGCVAEPQFLSALLRNQDRFECGRQPGNAARQLFSLDTQAF